MMSDCTRLARGRQSSKWRLLIGGALPLLVFASILAFNGKLADVAHAAPANQVGGSTTGHLTLVGTMSPSRWAAPPQSSSASLAPLHLVPHSAGPGNKAPGAPTLTVPVVRGNGVEPTGHGSDLNANFTGLKAFDNGAFGNGSVEPPDQGLCVSSLQVLEMVNNVVAFYNRSGSLIAGPVNLASFFAENVFISDPRCYFDPTTSAWFFTVTAIDFTAQRSHVDVLVAKGANLLAAPFVKYTIDTTDDGTNGTPSHLHCPCLADQPLLGADAFGVYVSTNEFSLAPLGQFFNGAQIYAISKKQLVAQVPPPPSPFFVHYENLAHGAQAAFSVQPAITRGDSAQAEFFLDELDVNGSNGLPGLDNRIGVWALTQQSLLNTGGMPTLSVIVITSETYGFPVQFSQRSGPAPLAAKNNEPLGLLVSANDDRMMQVVFSGGSLWSSLNTIVQVQGDPDNTPRDGVAWFNITPTVSNNVVTGAEIRQGYVAVQGDYLLYPSIALSAQGQAKLVVSLAGPDFFPTAAYALFNASDGGGKFGDIRFAAAGVGPEDGASCLSGMPGVQGACRWGDYSAAVTDPSDGSVWMAVEFINQSCTSAQYSVDPTCGGTRDPLANWATRIFQLNPRA
jgi:hypothetical protein